MNWQYKKAVTRIFNTFRRLNKNIYDEDVEALKSLNELIDTSAKNFIHSNLVYAKLLAIHLRQNLHYYGNVKQAIVALSDELKNPLNYQIELLTQEINSAELSSYLESLGIDTNKIVISSSEKGIKEKEIIKENQRNIIEKLNKFWSFNNVENSFYNTANDILKDVNNYS